MERRQVEAMMKTRGLTSLWIKFELDDTVTCALIMFENIGIKGDWHCCRTLKRTVSRPSIVFAADEDGIHIKGSALLD